MKMAEQLSEEEQQQERREATLKFTVLSAEGVKDVRILGRMKCFAVAWVDPRFKTCTKTLNCFDPNPTWNQQLSFSLSHRTIQDPDSRITIQILSPSSPIRNEKLIGSTTISLSRIPFDAEEVFTLQLWRPSGRAQGLLRVKGRVECHDNVRGGYYPIPPVGCVTGIPVQSNSLPLPLDHSPAMESGVLVQNDPLPFEESGFIHTVPSAPPMPEPVDTRWSFLAGMLSGAVAAVLIGSSLRR